MKTDCCNRDRTRGVLDAGSTCLVLILMLLACGCVSPPRSIIAPVPEEGGPQQLDTVAIRAPEGPGWVYYTEQRQGITHLVFLRKSESPSNHYMADLAELQASPDIDSEEEIKESVIRRMFDFFAPGRRYEIVREEYAASERYGVPGLDCRFELKDFEAPGAGDAEYLLEHMFGHVFAHPDVPGLFILVGYQERGHAHELDADGKAKAEAFFRGLELHGGRGGK